MRKGEKKSLKIRKIFLFIYDYCLLFGDISIEAGKRKMCHFFYNGSRKILALRNHNIHGDFHEIRNSMSFIMMEGL